MLDVCKTATSCNAVTFIFAMHQEKQYVHLFTCLMYLKLSPPLKCCSNIHAKLCAQSVVQEAWVIRAITAKTEPDWLCLFRNSQQSQSKQRTGQPGSTTVLVASLNTSIEYYVWAA